MSKPVKLVIFDLDGTLLDTESLVCDVSQRVLAAHGATLTPEAVKAGLGKRPLEAWQAVVDLLGLPVPAQQLYDESEPLLTERWGEARLMPGAGRLLHHLHDAGVPMAVATSTPRRTYERKMSGSAGAGLAARFDACTCGDEVEQGKPAPDCFTATAARLGVDPSECLCFEDAPTGVEAATAAGMRVVVIPSLAREEYPKPIPDATAGCCRVLPSLLDVRPEEFGLPPFTDQIEGTVRLDPVWRLRGTVVRGFGRGSKELGIPTANLDSASLHGQLAEAVTGIYAGWASVGESAAVYPTALSIGYNPYYKNQEKTVEPWILHDFEEDFYGEELRLVVCAYIRPEADFTTVEDLIACIYKDADITRAALQHEPLASYSADEALRPSTALPSTKTAAQTDSA